MERSLALAEKMGQRHESGMTLLEMGQRLDERKHLERAEALFGEIGAGWDLARARESLEEYRLPDRVPPRSALAQKRKRKTKRNNRKPKY